MPGETTLASNDEVAQLLRVVQIQADSEEMGATPVTDVLYETDAYARALQALRDVRHLLPCEGVAIVAALLDLAT